MNSKLFSLLLSCFVLLTLSSCSDESPRQMSPAERLIGTWTYHATQEKVNGEWKNMPSQENVQGEETFNSDSTGFISMRFDGEEMSTDFRWELKDGNQYYTEGHFTGTLLFEGNDRFLLYYSETFDPITNGKVSGEFRDIYDRKSNP